MPKWTFQQAVEAIRAKYEARRAREKLADERKRARAVKKRRSAQKQTRIEKAIKLKTEGKFTRVKVPAARLRKAKKALREATAADRAAAAKEAKRKWAKDHPEVRKAWLAAHPHYRKLYRLGYRVLAPGMIWPSAEQTEAILRLHAKFAAS